MAFLTQFAISASYNISYAPYVSDYSRFVFVGFNVVNVSLIMGGLNLVFGLDPPWRSPSSSRAACWRSTGTT